MSTRIIVKGLPAQVTEAQLRTTFEQYGTITDLSLKKTDDGKSRRFAFVGFSSAEECRKAVRGANNCFIQTAKVVVRAYPSISLYAQDKNPKSRSRSAVPSQRTPSSPSPGD